MNVFPLQQVQPPIQRQPPKQPPSQQQQQSQAQTHSQQQQQYQAQAPRQLLQRQVPQQQIQQQQQNQLQQQQLQGQLLQRKVPQQLLQQQQSQGRAPKELLQGQVPTQQLQQPQQSQTQQRPFPKDLLPPSHSNIPIQATLTNSFDPISGLHFEPKSRNKIEAEHLIEGQGEVEGGHLRNIREVMFRDDTNYTIISAKCLPQMRLNEKDDYSVFLKITSPERKVLYDKEMTVCTCPSGKGYEGKNGMKYCKHISAVYLWINMERFESKTDKNQQWHTHSQHVKSRYPKVNDNLASHTNQLHCVSKSGKILQIKAMFIQHFVISEFVILAFS